MIHRQNGQDLKVKYAISSVEKMLPQHLFLRIHRSFIVSREKITAFSNSDVEIGRIELPIGKSFSEVVKTLAGNGSFHPGPAV